MVAVICIEGPARIGVGRAFQISAVVVIHVKLAAAVGAGRAFQPAHSVVVVAVCHVVFDVLVGGEPAVAVIPVAVQQRAVIPLARHALQSVVIVFDVLTVAVCALCQRQVLIFCVVAGVIVGRSLHNAFNICQTPNIS